MIAAQRLMFFVSFILSQDMGDQHGPDSLSQWLDLAQKIHLCFLGDYMSMFGQPCHVENNCLLFGGLLLWPLNMCEAEMKRVPLVLISPVNYWYRLLRILSPGELRWGVSPEIIGRSHRHVVWAGQGRGWRGAKLCRVYGASLMQCCCASCLLSCLTSGALLFDSNPNEKYKDSQSLCPKSVMLVKENTFLVLMKGYNTVHYCAIQWIHQEWSCFIRRAHRFNSL